MYSIDTLPKHVFLLQQNTLTQSRQLIKSCFGHPTMFGSHLPYMVVSVGIWVLLDEISLKNFHFLWLIGLKVKVKSLHFGICKNKQNQLVSNTPFTLTGGIPRSSRCGQNVPVLHLSHDIHLQTCVKVACHPIPSAIYRNFKMFRPYVSHRHSPPLVSPTTIPL